MKKNYFNFISNAPLFLKSSKESHLGILRFLFFIFLFFSSTTTTYAQCNVVKNGTFDSNFDNWTSSQPSGLGWYHYSSVGFNNNGQAYIYRDGAVDISLKQTLNGLLGNSLTLSFKIRGQNAGRSAANCPTTAKLEIKIDGTTYMIIDNPGGNSQITNSNIAVFNGASYTPTNGFTLTVAGADESAMSQGTITLTIPWVAKPLTADLEFLATSSNLPEADPCVLYGGDDWYLDDISVIAANPTATGVTICQGTTSGALTSLESSTNCGNQNIQTGFRNPGNAISDTTIPVLGSIQWNNPGYIISAGTPYATASTTNNGEITRYLKATGYGFSIPANATIRGITAVINRQSSNNSNNISDNSIKIVKGGTIIGTEKSTGDIWNTSFSTYTYGGSSDLWGTTWLPADINNTNFGIVLSAKTNTNDTRALSVDYMQISVTYTVPSSINWYTVSSGGTAIGSGSSFNPVGVSNSGLANTNIPGTYTFYTACSSNTECRTAINFVINPTPAITNMTATSCSTIGFSASPVNGTNGVVPSGTTYSWSAPSVTGITGSASGANLTNISGNLTNTTNAPINVVYTVTPTSGSCPGSTFTVTVTVNPRPTITNMTAISCSTIGFSASPVNGTNGVVPSGTTYSWSAPNVTGITGTAAGTSATGISGNLTNTTNAPINVVYTVTPTSGSCPGSTFTVTVTVNPRPAITNMTAISCSTIGFSASPVNGTNGVVPSGTTYSWSAPSVTGITGSAAGTSATNISGNLTNTTNAPINVVYTVTPISGSCSGSTFTVTVTVNPRPAITNMTAISCSTIGFSASPVNGTNGVVPSGTTYSWSAPSVTGITGTAAGTSATGISDNLTNTTNAPINVVYTVTPTSGSCPGSTFTVTVTVNPRPAITNMTAISCSTIGFSASPVNGTNGVVPSGTTYSWSAPSVTGITGTAAGTSATGISGNLTNTTNAPINVVYTVTPTSGSCPGSTFTVTVTVNPRPAITNMTAISCSTIGFSASPVNGTNGVVPSGTTYSWSAPSVTGITGSAAGTSATNISGNLTNTTNAPINVVYTVTPISGSCSGSTFTVSVTVNPRPTITNMTAISCSTIGFSASPVNGTNGVVPSGTTYSWSAPSVTGITGTAAGTSATGISGNLTNTTNAPINVVYTVTPTSGSCPGSTFTVTVTVNALPTTPTAVVTAQPNCSELTGTITLSGLPPSGTINQTINGFTTSFAISQIGGEQTITNLAAGSYTFTVTLQGSCTSLASNQVSIDAFSGAIVKWRNSQTVLGTGEWFPGNPTINDRVKFERDYISGTDSPANVNACSCYINSNASVTFKKGHTLNVLNEVRVESGSLTFESEASLVQHTDVLLKPNFGSITYERKTTITRYDYTYWSSPVKDQTLKNLSYYTLFDRYFKYDDGWVTIRSGNAPMYPGHGYIIRGPQNSSITEPATFSGVFKGEVNNGVINDLAVVAGKDYLLGNPYPSAIDADKFIDANATRLQGTLYFWTHNTEPVAAQGTTTYKYAASDYASYNRTGGTGTAADSDDNEIKEIPTGKIGAGQGFFARATAAPVGNVLFNNSMRLAATQTSYLDNSQFFKLDTGKNAVTAVTITEKNRVWLNLTNTEGAFKQLLVGYITGATNEYDNGFDGVTYNGNSFVDFYSVNQDKNLVIQGRALPFVKKDSVALGYNTTIKGDFKISIDQVDGIFTTQNVLLEDKELKVQHDLKKEAYTFTTEKGIFNNRFVLRYVDKNAVDEVIIPEVPGEDSDAGVMVSVKDDEIKINSTLTKLDRVVVYDVAGRKLFQKNKIDANVLLIPHFVWNHQVLVVDIVLSDGTKIGKKIIN